MAFENLNGHAPEGMFAAFVRSGSGLGAASMNLAGVDAACRAAEPAFMADAEVRQGQARAAELTQGEAWAIAEQTALAARGAALAADLRNLRQQPFMQV